ncbi:MAG: hypothetical protein UR85_C0009G0021 [Candidatus Nomurabacteria bacterium GW2011_GWF2_35_66]|uniref:Transcobalamin-like C-terminal domain-containing protein n=1 Tax=Candidatus Nomurabacteria bacterium GW2011_GWE1_35_16 TaxID=1618761 RepID=A0A0G0EFD2_9BACT|nr:MAG: hypothetical protein UR55_C0014G0021 [Candidatus Nomurabacteria bacterium GW2011_GWF1_34_20]KKP62096.1 MAG: hypothetical protein UR57_C0013G0021 [Candidatus Nomurabacteria bacterium GW2011_GWE2_34_25]KKP66062.1 MAG: hypothetical protein UR64_C0013G0021 [Candidatus Nomurabacteria bacterium GW2011_GWE1_35_16]KKP83032.1 MAG: hypothetical protein UR85_C0009G0021 [Candidatus Nomurabacteria bacterium GW2011_GWF2_35_66]HAE36971.1 hypothetical protein [Candidatus Nomurabacteria bacterium]
MKTKEQKILIGGLVILLIFIISFLYLNFNSKESFVIDTFKKDAQIENLPEPPSTKEAVKVEKVLQIESKALSVNMIKVSLNVFDKKYEVETKEGTSVFEMMKILEEKSTPLNTFSFQYKEVSGLGSFITEINGVKGTPGKYWMYYVNDKLASVGVSQYILKDGDIINWKNEGI